MANGAAQREEVPRPNNTGMPDNLKSGIESLSGFSMDDVRVHYNSSKPATVQALAYTQGTDIHVAPGQEKHLPHEAWHVAQQMAGRVSPTTNINGMPVNDNAGLEHEADVMGEKALQCKSCGVYSRIIQSSAKPIQCYKKEGEFVVSKTRKYAVKENEASTLYVNDNVAENNTYVQNLKKLGICSANIKPDNLEGFTTFKQHERLVNDNKKLSFNLPMNAFCDSIEELQCQSSMLQNLIEICEKMQDNQRVTEEEIGKIKKYESEYIQKFNRLGADIFYDIVLINKMLSQHDAFDESLLNIVLADLKLRNSQINNELDTKRSFWENIWKRFLLSLPDFVYRNKMDYGGLKTECGALADQIERIFLEEPEYAKLGLKIESPEKQFNNDIIIWGNHFTSKIASDDTDVLCIEEASGKSYDGNQHLANAHWFARIYGENENVASDKNTEESFCLNIKKPSNISIRNESTWIFKDLSDNELKVIYDESDGGVFYGTFELKDDCMYKKDFLLQTACCYLNKMLVRKYYDE